jgi:hypothetical protein
MLRFESRVQKLLEGAVDLHVHSGPDIFPRIVNDIDAAQMAKEQGMRAIYIKSQIDITCERAAIATQQTGFPVFGGVCLNYYVGGLSLLTVEAALLLGAKQIYLPTLHAHQWVSSPLKTAHLSWVLKEGMKGIYMLKEDGTLKDELYPIFKKIAEYDVILGTGHIGVAEAKVVVREAAKAGVKKILVTHPLSTWVNYTVPDLKELIDLGATCLEHTYCSTTRQVSTQITPKYIADTIRASGAQYTVLTTDAGQWLNPVPVQQMGIYIRDMLDNGISEADIRLMIATNPAKLLGLE